jgi:large subunit ribosomal protein L11
MAAKDIKRIVDFMAYAGIAKPTAKLGQALGPLGLNMAQVCKDFNEMSQNIRPEVPVRVKLSAFYDKTYKLELQGPPTNWLIKKASGCMKGSASPFFEPSGTIAITSIYEIAKLKKELDFNLKDVSLQSICSVILM